MGIEGGLKIQLELGHDAGNRVLIESSRPVHASAVFVGKRVAESLQLIPLLYSICATAQTCAGVRACEQALGLRATLNTEYTRDLLVSMETLREHLWRILLDWPAFIDREADQSAMTEVVALQRSYQQALRSGANLFQPGGAECHSDLVALKSVVDRLAGLLEKNVFALSATEWLKLPGEQALADWAESGETIAAQLVDQILRAGWGGAGACDSVALPQMSETQLHQSMQDKDYVRQPQWSGQCFETSSLTRTDSPLLESLKQTYGNGLVVRLVARLTEIARLAEQLLPDEAAGTDDCKVSEQKACNPGIGQTAAARGQLVHRVTLHGDLIRDYQILAPTEWNFHPQGVVVQALSALKGDRDQVEKQARLLINAIDPCVGYELNIVN